MSGVEVRLLGSPYAKAAGAVLTASHAEYPAFRALFPDPSTRRRVLLPFQTGAVRDAVRYGRVFGAFTDGRLVAVAVWQPPGRFPLSAARKARMTPALLRSAVAAPRAFPRFARAGAALERAFPDEPVWYLQILGVHPSAQRRGAGRALLIAGLALVDADRAPCYLTTSDPLNVEYYRPYGFELIQPGFPGGPGGPTYYGMQRPPVNSA
jgi:ribosomal protein S18 acetylase RimI-like enzyme